MRVTPAERWNRVAALIDTALERAPEERARYLEEMCAGDAALRIEIDALLARGEAPSFLDAGALAFAAPLLDPVDDIVGLTMPNDVAVGAGLPYSLERRIGRGGMATVYLARDTKHDRRVAVKVLHAGLTTRVEGERFVQEIRLTARLQHPHVLGLLDSGVFAADRGTLAGRPYYVMPFVEGESLRARLARGNSLSLGEAVRVLREVADALCYAHAHGVIHRDIKPENILMSGGHAMVADFGIAKALFASQAQEPWRGTGADALRDTVGHLSALVGTPAYMAPEQASAKGHVDHSADLYAWGVVAYELLARRHPFTGRRSAQELVTAHREEMPQPLDEAAPEVPRGLAAIVMRCLAKAPAERPSSSAAIVAALDAAMVAPPPRSVRSLARRLSLGILVALVVTLGLAAAAATFYWKQRRSELTQRAVLVTGTGNPDTDVAAVQAAVDRADTVFLKGHFSFDTSPTKPIDPVFLSGSYPPAAEVLVSKAVVISGTRDANGELTTIEGGLIPFFVDTRDGRVTIRGLHFVRPTTSAVLVRAVRGLEISFCKIDSLRSFGERRAFPSRVTMAIAINTLGDIPAPANPGNPEEVSGHLLITRNDIDAAGEIAQDATTGVIVFSVGQLPDRAVDLDVIGNVIRNATAGTINLRRVEGRTRVVSNTLSTSAEAAMGTDAVRLANVGSYLIASNKIESRQVDGIGIAVFSQFPQWPIERAVVEDNDVLMSPRPGGAFGDSSAGIAVRGFAHGNIVRHNTIRGRARAALATYVFKGGVPADNEFIDNRFENFHATVADIFVGSGVVKRRIVGPGTLMDQGAGPTIQR